jgi:hypothetical protein
MTVTINPDAPTVPTSVPPLGPAAPGPAVQPSPAPALDPNAPPKAPVGPQPEPTVVHPVRRGGLAGIVDEFRDAVAGKTGSEVYTDDDGNKYIRHPQLSHGQQWFRIAADAIRGAAAGAEVGQGPGGPWRAANAGVRSADEVAKEKRQQNKEMSDEVKQANLEHFNAVKLKHDAAAQEFQLQRLKINATQQDIEFAQKQIDREHALGSADLGIYKDEADLARVKDAHPEFWKDVYKNNIVAVPELNEKGERHGIHVFLRTPGVGSQPVEPGTAIKVFTPGKNPTDPPTLTEQVPTVPMTHDMVDAYNNAAITKYQKWYTDKGEQELKTAQAREATAKTGAVPSEIEKNYAEAQRARSEATAAGPSNPKLVDSIGMGMVAPTTLGRLLSGKAGQKLLEDVLEKYSDVDTSKLSSYPKLYLDFTSGKTAQTLQNLNTAFKTVNDLNALNTYASRLPTGKARTAWDSKLTSAAAEIANGLTKPGATATKEEIARVHKSLDTNFARQSAIDTQIGSLIEQYGSIRDKWSEGAPSAVYEAKMPDVGSRTKEIIYKHDPEQAGKWFGVPYYDKPGGRLIGFSRDGGKTLEPVQ